MCGNLSLEPTALPRTHRPPKNWASSCIHTWISCGVKLRIEFYRVQDTVDAKISDRFMQPGIQTLKELEASLLTPTVSDAAVQKNPELQVEDLRVQLPMFKCKYNVTTTADAVHALKESPLKSMPFLISLRH